MFRGWENFYLLVGGAAGSLIGLLFIVVTLTAGGDRERTLRGQSIYMTPNLFHLAVELTLSAAFMAPGLGTKGAGALLAGAGLLGAGYAATTTLRITRLNRDNPPHWSDVWCYGVLPLIVYLGMLPGAPLAWSGAAIGPVWAAVALMVLLLVAIRNAWDLVTWIAPRRDRPEPSPEPSPEP